MRALTIVMLISVALAGCADSPTETEPVDDAHAEDEQVMETNETVEAEEINNTAPVAILGIEGLNSTEEANFTAPAMFNLTIDGTDAEADNLTWTLVHFNGTENATFEGDAVPAMESFNLTAGNHTFTLTVFDGELEGTSELLLVVAEGAPEVDPNEPIDYGTFIFFPETGHCNYKEYDDYIGEVYNFDFWVFAEDNGVPGLQVGNTYPVGAGEDAGFYLAEWDICQDADLMLV